MINSSISDCTFLSLNKIHNQAGNITVVEGLINLPFSIKRVFYLYDIPGGESRGGHAHKELYQLIIAAAGSFEVFIDDGKNQKIFTLNRPDKAVLITPGIWSKQQNFSSGAICLVIASHFYNENDYIRDYNFFIEKKTK
jgi:WxcM-like, C-terminal